MQDIQGHMQYIRANVRLIFIVVSVELLAWLVVRFTAVSVHFNWDYVIYCVTLCDMSFDIV